MTAAAPSARPLAWLDAVLSFLPEAAPSLRVPDPPEEYRPLMEIGRDALGARDLADLHARLDGAVMRLRGVLGTLPQVSEDALRALPEHPREGSIVARALGLNVARKLLQAMHEMLPLLQALPVLRSGELRGALASRALRVRPWSLHDGEVVPHALVASAIVQVRGVVALGALLSACLDARQPEPWLTNALADAFLASVRETARLMASAGLDVGRRPDNLLDLAGLFKEAEEADAAFVAAFEKDVKAGHVGVPEDE